MKYWLTVSIALAFLIAFSTGQATAQGFASFARANASGNMNRRAASGCLANLPNASSAGDQSGWRNGLPPTRTDSFVKEAKHHAAHIYGDEGTYGLPPYMGFSKVHRINTGIMDERDAGLTTGHGSYMPDAWGGDEFHQNEWSQSGERGHTAASGYPDGLPVMTGAGQSGPGGSQNIPPPPGPGYQAAYTCEGFVGYYSPEEVALAQTDFPAAFDHFVHSDRYTGSILNADLILRLQMGRPGF
ncbi:MAG: hypothetical protein IT343_08005 [Candidatus Melainabacteria bacterium]|nr:hypothetical protein [Candidatus Melainabacteria bacterium]